MLIAKKCSFEQIKDGVYVAIIDDKHGLKKYIDPIVTREIKNTKDAIKDIIEKMEEYSNNGVQLFFYNVYCGDKLIGFFNYRVDKGINILVNFGLSVEHRTKNIMLGFFSLFKANLSDCFYCALWKKNSRAINWLVSMGMTEINKINESGFEMLIFKN